MSSFPNLPGLLIVAGFSCAGKSSYIRHIVTRDPKLQNASPVYEYMLRRQLRDGLAPGDIFHLDLSAVNADAATQSNNLVKSHPLHRRTVDLGFPVAVDFVVAPAIEIYRRIIQRSHLGLGWRDDNVKGTYPKWSKLQTLQATELSHLYNAWRLFFEANKYRCRYFHSHRGDFLPLCDWSQAEAVLKNATGS